MNNNDPLDSEWWQAQSDLYYGENLTYELSFDGWLTPGFLRIQCGKRMAASRIFSPWCGRMARHLRALEEFNHLLVYTPHDCIAGHFRWQIARQPLVHPLPTEPAERRVEMIRRWRAYLLDEVPDLMRDPEIARAFAIILVYRNFAASDRVTNQLDRLLLARYGEESMSDWFKVRVIKRGA